MMSYKMLCSEVSYVRESVVLGDHSSLFCKGSTHRFELGPQCSKLQWQASFPHPPLKSLFLALGAWDSSVPATVPRHWKLGLPATRTVGQHGRFHPSTSVPFPSASATGGSESF